MSAAAVTDLVLRVVRTELDVEAEVRDLGARVDAYAPKAGVMTVALATTSVIRTLAGKEWVVRISGSSELHQG